MNIELYNYFFNGEINKTLKLSNYDLEIRHDVIQWVFPLKEPSLFNPDAPLLDDETIKAIKESKECQEAIYQSGKRFYKFYYIDQYDDMPHWLSERNHNFLRITRIIKSLRLLGQPDAAKMFYDLGKHYYDQFPDIISNVTMRFWDEANKS
jgi:hypothetical protein